MMKISALFLFFLSATFSDIHAQLMDRTKLRDNRVKQINSYRVSDSTKYLEYTELVNDSGQIYKMFTFSTDSSGPDTLIYICHYSSDYNVLSDTTWWKGLVWTSNHTYGEKNIRRTVHKQNDTINSTAIFRGFGNRSISRTYTPEGKPSYVSFNRENKKRSTWRSYRIHEGKRRLVRRSQNLFFRKGTLIVRSTWHWREKKRYARGHKIFVYDAKGLLTETYATRTENKGSPIETRYVYEYIFR